VHETKSVWNGSVYPLTGQKNVSLIFCPRSAFDGAKTAPLFALISAPYLLYKYCFHSLISVRSFSLHSENSLLFSFSLFFLRNYSVVSIIERLLPYWIDIRISIIWCISDRLLQCSSVSVFSLKTAVLSWGLRGRYTTVHFSSSSAKRLKESDLVRDSANSLFLCQF
jgi:hypothetical protein